METIRSGAWGTAALLLVLAACEAREIHQFQATAECVRCHGGTDNATGAPPRDRDGNVDASLVSVGAHTSHLSARHGIAAPVACESCHVVPARWDGNATHLDGVAQVSFNAFAARGVSAPAWDRNAGTCNVYCHGATLSGGSATAPVWTDLDGSERQCGSCHGVPPPRPHVPRTDCSTCHPATVDANGIIAGGAHLDGDVDVDFSSMGCADCHGDAQRAGTDLSKAAPPIGTHAETATDTLAVGAHQAHLAKASVAQPVACSECHVVPSSPGHPNDVVDVAFGTLATNGAVTPAWDRGTATCSSTYCHGATVGGGTNKQPTWTAGPSQAACGTCHGTPPPPPHPSSGLCNTCHPSTVNADGTLNVAGGAHVNGSLEAQRFHPAGWAAPSAHGFGPLGANVDIASCKGCHGADLTGGGVGVSCDTCHDAVPGVVNWRTNCTFCHGDVQRADPIEAAPPVGTEGELGTLQRAVGAHQRHLVDGQIRQAIACTECHAVPADILQPQHVNGAVDLTWGPLATARTAAAAFDAVSLTCANYCHGAVLSGGGMKTPVWTRVDGTQDDCDDCHGNPPPAKANGQPHPTLTECRACHALTVAADAHPVHTIDVAGGRHVDGQVQVTAFHPAGWAVSTSHGYEANRNLASCKTCHGADLLGGSVGVSCDTCHNAVPGVGNWRTNCTFCHGDASRPVIANRPAPPVGSEGETAATDRAVGAHQPHLAGGALGRPIACTECHAIPADIAQPAHVNGVVNLAFGTLATADAAGATFNPADLSCANYCHGATLAGGSRPNPIWTAANQATCGACHGLPPPAPHPVVAGGTAACRGCHLDTVDATGAIIPAGAGGLHIDGVSQVRAHDASWTAPTSPANPGFHAFFANAGLSSCQGCHGINLDGPTPQSACAACHGAGAAPSLATCTGCHGGTNEGSGAPPRNTWGNAADAVRTGAHTAHVTTDIAPPIGCAVCHVTPASAFAAGHLDPSPAEVSFSGIALGSAPWKRANASCSVYCHGSAFSGGSNISPDWTGGPAEATCGSCHALPPPALRSGSAHPATSSDPRICSACHPQTIDATGAIIAPAAGGLHLDGAPQAQFGHDTAWSSPASPSFHAFSANQGLANCQVCHGPLLDGGAGAATTVGCDDCHGAGTAPALACTGCHGGTDNATGAPPRPQWAFRSNAPEAALRNGAHTTHVSASAIAPAFGCSVCHTTPADMFAAGHIDSSTAANVVFTGLASNGITPAPAWSRAAPTCAVYCHGATLAGGSLTTPTWTAVGQGQADCGTCHGIPPTNPPHPTVPASLPGCHDCHPTTIDAAGAIIAPLAGGKHLNGQIDGGHTASWMTPASVANPDFHAYAANRGLANCRICHGPNLDGVGGSTTVGCQDCHSPTGPAPTLTCTGCHGGTDNETGAPPRATWGSTSAVAIGAHSTHVGTNPISAPIACSECHVQPASLASPGHPNGAVTVTFQGAVSGLRPATWNYPTSGTPTCSSTHCHGNFTGGVLTNAPNWNGANQAACGTCHGPEIAATPAREAGRGLGFLHRRHERQDYTGIQPWWPVAGQSGWVTCDQCHFGIASSVNNLDAPALTQVDGGGPPLHVNGTKNVVFKLGGNFDPVARTCSSMQCHPGETKNW